MLSIDSIEGGSFFCASEEGSPIVKSYLCSRSEQTVAIYSLATAEFDIRKPRLAM